jgi:hypothetical protein
MDEDFRQTMREHPSLSMARVPRQVKDEFIEFARDFFCDDYGMAFAHVWDLMKHYQLEQAYRFAMVEQQQAAPAGASAIRNGAAGEKAIRTIAGRQIQVLNYEVKKNEQVAKAAG